MKNPIKIASIVIVLAVAVVVFFVGDKILGLLNLSIRNMDFKYQAQNKEARWVEFMTPLAQEVGKIYGIPWQAIVVQTALETGWGKSSLFQTNNNFGGIKATKGQKSISLPTWEVINGNKVHVNADFATFPSKYEGLIGYAKFFHVNPRYKEALKYPNDPHKFIYEIRKAGYATDPNYVAKLNTMLTKYFT